MGDSEVTNGTATTKTTNNNLNKTPRYLCPTQTVPAAANDTPAGSSAQTLQHTRHYPHHGGSGGSGDASTTSGDAQGVDGGIVAGGGGSGGSGGCGESGGPVEIAPSEACASGGAVANDNTHRQRDDIADVTSPRQDDGAEGGGGARGARGGGTREEAAVADSATGDRDGNGSTVAGTHMEHKGVKGRTRGGGSGSGCGVVAAASAPAGGWSQRAIASNGYFRRIWELQASEALSARERGLLPNEHPVQSSPEVILRSLSWSL